MRGRVLSDWRVRFEGKFQKTDGCWLWTGTTHKNGYGLFSKKVETGWKTHWAHRVSFEFYERKLLPGETIDHLCGVTNCVNPHHLEAVSIGENSRRSPRTLSGMNIRKTHCPRGHPYSGSNLTIWNGKRFCKECARLSRLKRKINREKI